MSMMYVDADALNLRSSPEIRPDTLIGKLYLTQPVTVIADKGDWVHCSARAEGKTKKGYVAKKHLRAPLTPNREKLIAAVCEQYERFAFGKGLEHIKPYSGYVGEMWKALGIANLDGTDRDQPWSAATISFMMRNAGPAYAKFKFASAHSKYVHQAIQARKKKDKTAPFWGYRLNEVRPMVGDIIAKDNPDYAPAVDYDVAAVQDAYRSHTDIVVKVDSEKQRLIAIGGNVSHSVGVTIYDLAPGDYAAPTKHVFAILRNMTDGDGPTS